MINIIKRKTTKDSKYNALTVSLDTLDTKTDLNVYPLNGFAKSLEGDKSLKLKVNDSKETILANFKTLINTPGISSTLLYFKQVEVDTKKGEIKVLKGDTQEAISMKEIADLWTARTTNSINIKDPNNNHLFLIIQSNQPKTDYNFNEFMTKVRKEYLFESISLLLLPDVNSIRDDHSVLNRQLFKFWTFIGNMFSIMNDFGIKLYGDFEPVEFEYCNNSKITQYYSETAYDERNNPYNYQISSVSYPNGDYYEGTLKDNKPDGFGTMIYLSSEVYHGHFTKGERLGRAVYLDYKRNKTIAKWDKNERNGFSKVFTNDGKKVYEGMLKNGKYDMVGKLYTEGNCVFEGYFKEGLKVLGTEFNKSGKKLYTGIFFENARTQVGKTFLNELSQECQRVGEVDADGKIAWGKFQSNYKRVDRVLWGQNLNKGEVNNKNWRVEGTSKALVTGYNLGEVSFEYEKINSNWGDLFGFYAMLSFYNHDLYLGEIGKYLPTGQGILYRHKNPLKGDNFSLEIGSFFSKKEGPEFPNEIREYYLKEGFVWVPKLNEFFFVQNRDKGIKGSPYNEVIKINPNGDVYSGRTDINIIPRDNKGKYFFYETKDTFTGIVKDKEFIEGRYFTNATGDEYKGHFQNNKYHGHGQLVFGSSLVYEKYTGNFKDGEIYGYGDLIFKTGARQKGFFVQKIVNGEIIISTKGIKETYYPTYQTVYTRGFSLGNGAEIIDTLAFYNNKSDKEKLKKINGETTFNTLVQKPSFKVSENGVKKYEIILGERNEEFQITTLFNNPTPGLNFSFQMSVNWLYFGELAGLVKEGKGKIKLKDKTFYVGQFKNDLYNGTGEECLYKPRDILYGNDIHKDQMIRYTQRGNFLNGKLNDFGLIKRDYTQNDNKIVQTFLEGYFAYEWGTFNQGVLKKGIKGVDNSDSKNFELKRLVVYVGTFEDEEIESINTHQKSKYFMKGIYLPKLTGFKVDKAKGGRIAQSEAFRKQFYLKNSGIDFACEIKLNELIKGSIKKRLVSYRLDDEIKRDFDKISDNIYYTAHGPGRLYDQEKNIKIYEGNFNEGSYSGKGISYDLISGEIFLGDIMQANYFSLSLPPKRGKFGVLIHLNLGIHMGEFKFEKINGKAICYFDNGVKFKGEMVEGVMQGKGKLFFPNGTHCEGYFEKNKMIGQAKFFYKNGDYLDCNLDEDSNIYGFATYTFSNNQKVLKTSFENNVNDGTGELKTPDYSAVGYFKGLKPDPNKTLKLKLNEEIKKGTYNVDTDMFVEDESDENKSKKKVEKKLDFK